jgi:hypothetical protein
VQEVDDAQGDDEEETCCEEEGEDAFFEDNCVGEVLVS